MPLPTASPPEVRTVGPCCGVTWDYLQYVVGLARLGHDVYYLEDTDQWPYNPIEGGIGTSGDFNAGFLAQIMARFGLEERWSYHFPGRDEWYGITEQAMRSIVSSADLVINISGCLTRPGDYRPAGRLAYIDTDPIFTQAKLVGAWHEFKAEADAHDVHFTFGETLGPDTPQTGHRWLPTRQPVLMEEWAHDRVATRPFTTVMNWASYDPIEYNGVLYGQKDIEFMKFVDLPAAVAPARLELAMSAAGKTGVAPLGLLRQKGWNVVSPTEVAGNLDDYRRYIQSSTAEWSIAKNGYVAGRSGWFSCRSACYLAAGRPVVMQDTGYSKVLPTGEGLLSFTTLEEAAAAVRAVAAEPERHRKAALALADAHLRAERVLPSLIERAFGST